MGVDKHEEARQGRRPRPNPKGPLAKTPLEVQREAPRVAPDAQLPSAATAPQLVPDAAPVRQLPQLRADEDDRHVMKIPKTWIREMADLTGEPASAPMECVRALLVLARRQAVIDGVVK